MPPGSSRAWRPPRHPSSGHSGSHAVPHGPVCLPRPPGLRGAGQGLSRELKRCAPGDDSQTREPARVARRHRQCTAVVGSDHSLSSNRGRAMGRGRKQRGVGVFGGVSPQPCPACGSVSPCRTSVGRLAWTLRVRCQSQPTTADRHRTGRGRRPRGSTRQAVLTRGPDR